MSELEDRIAVWVAGIASNRLHIAPLADTDSFVGKVKGIPSIAAVGVSEALVMEMAKGQLHAHAQKLLGSHRELPTFRAPSPPICDDMKALLRMSTLRRLLKERASSWGGERDRLPSHILCEVAADIDQVISRHAAAIQPTC